MPPKELVEIIRQVHAGKKRIPPEIAAYLAEHISDEALTGREIEVLQQIAGANRNRDIADKLFITEETVMLESLPQVNAEESAMAAGSIPLPKLDLATDKTPTETIVHCTGKITSDTAQSLKMTVKPLLSESKTVVLDLKNVSYMDSSGLGTIVGL